MIVGVGLDNVQTKRMQEVLLKWADRVENRIFTEEELAYSRTKGEPHFHLAARFAAKEAFFKALGKGLSEGMSWTNVNVLNDELGKPYITLRGRARELADSMEVKITHLSLTHTDESAIAVVILEK
ncbi:MAG: holo-[acyl-carrier-protein] synthase [Deltaproteobacteria bacterium]|nr:holo-[acyl-carrier-protein] synthase [Deltaproteobacteria bacterium]